MHHLEGYIEHLKNFEQTASDKNKIIATDFAHNMLIYGVVLSHKPDEVLEIGVGSGNGTKAILAALDYNKKGKLTCVDNYIDHKKHQDMKETDGHPPIVNEMMNHERFNIVVSSEEDFVSISDKDLYDVIISDADHGNCGNWVEKVFDMCKEDGVIFVHDVHSGNLGSPGKYVDYAREKSMPCIIFNKVSRNGPIPIAEATDGERTHRGMAMIVKKTLNQ
jgi:predicted O-methyltransferase YrrM